MNIEKQLDRVKTALSQSATRQEFLAEWLGSQAARVIGQDPVQRGRFAGAVGMTTDELRLWGNAACWILGRGYKE